MNLLNLQCVDKGNKTTPVSFKMRRVVNAGYTGRDTASVKAHIAELEKEGITPPSSVPMIFPVMHQNVTLDDEIEVAGDKTSGEVEFVLLLDQDEIFVGVGSDHTDRTVEAYSIPISKQVCPNVMAPTVWRLRDVQEVWDDLILQSWVRENEEDQNILYQKATLDALLSPENIIDYIKTNIADGDYRGLVIYSGTIPILTPEMIYGTYFCSELINPHQKQTISCRYRIQRIDYLTV